LLAWGLLCVSSGPNAHWPLKLRVVWHAGRGSSLFDFPSSVKNARSLSALIPLLSLLQKSKGIAWALINSVAHVTRMKRSKMTSLKFGLPVMRSFQLLLTLSSALFPLSFSLFPNGYNNSYNVAKKQILLCLLGGSPSVRRWEGEMSLAKKKQIIGWLRITQTRRSCCSVKFDISSTPKRKIKPNVFFFHKNFCAYNVRIHNLWGMYFHFILFFVLSSF
jgi:hypothetical protein